MTNEATYTLRDVVHAACSPLDWSIGQTFLILFFLLIALILLPFIKMMLVLYKDVW